jgi:hypothetical protein
MWTCAFHLFVLSASRRCPEVFVMEPTHAWRLHLCLPLIRPIGSRSPPPIFVMKPTDARHLHHVAQARWLHTPRVRRVLSQR